MKKSGLGDSPIFSSVSATSQPLSSNDTMVKQKADTQKQEIPKNRTDVQTFKSTSVQMNKRTDERDYRVTKRNAYDLYLDQIRLIDDESARRSHQTGKHVGKSEILREIVDFYISKKMK